MQGTPIDINNKEAENKNADYDVLEKTEEALESGEYRTAFRLFRRHITGILCREGILDVCSPYYFKNGRVKEDKVAAELIGVYEYYYATNDGFRSFRPNGETFRCGRHTASFIGAVKKFLNLIAENPCSDPWEIYHSCMDSNYFDLEKYLDKAAAYSFPHNNHSRNVAGKILVQYVEKYYGNIGLPEFIDLYQRLDTIYCTYGFPFACSTHSGWFFEGYDVLYRNILDEGAWTLHDLWEQGASEWLKKQMEPYPEIRSTYEGLIKALQKPEYESLLCRLFPFRLTEDTLRSGYGMDSDAWEEFTLKLAKTLHFAECCIGKKNVSDYPVKDTAKAMNEVLKTILCYMDNEKMQ